MFSSHPSIVPVITFHGPGLNGQITAVSSGGQEVARFTAEGSRKHFSISRATSHAAAPVHICTGTFSSWSDETKLNVHGSELKLCRDNLMSFEAHVKTPLGKMYWRDDNWGGSKFKLVDKSKTVLARMSIKERRCDVLMPGDEMLFDSVLSNWIGYLLYHDSHALGSASGGGSHESMNVGDAVKIFSATAKIDGLADAGDDGGL